MSKKPITSEQPITGWRMTLGILLFACSIAFPLVGIPVLSTIGLSTADTASISGALLVGAEVFGIVAIAVMGKSGFANIKKQLSRLIVKIGPPQKVSKTRYIVGLVMFSITILFGWVSIYIADSIPGYADSPLSYAIGGDLLLISSLFILVGDFWDKLRALFVYDSRVVFNEQGDNAAMKVEFN